jgi:hypothetical protein
MTVELVEVEAVAAIIVLTMAVHPIKVSAEHRP